MKKVLFLLVVLLTTSSYAQFEDIFATQGDADTFVTNFSQPLFEGLLSSTNANWTTSARPIKPFKFELNIGASGAFVPTSKESFTFNNSDYQYLRIDSGPNVVPTVLGDVSHTELKIVIPINNAEVKVMSFSSPNGIKTNLPMNIVPAPNIQFSMGLPLGTEVNARYLPKISGNHNSYLQILGLGVKHSLTQYFPAKKDEKGKKIKRKFNVAIHAAFQKISAGTDFSSGKSTNIDMSTISAQAIASIDYKLLSFYSSVGYTKGLANFRVLGTFNYTYDIQDNNGNHIRTETLSVTDPLTLDFNLNEMKANFGVKLKIVAFQIYADYTLQKYPVANAGIGFMF